MSSRSTSRAETTRRTRVISDEEIEEYNINLLPNEIQYQIIDQMSLDDLRKVFLAIEDPHVRKYAQYRGKKYIEWWNSDIRTLAVRGDIEAVQWVADQGADILDDQVIIAAAMSGNLELVQWLAYQGADILDDQVIRNAAGSGNLELVKWLADQGADILNVDVIRYAAESDNLDMVKWLADQGADIR